jgi:hypothetical protein
MTEKRQTSQGYIIRILQHFATKLWNITNFVMLFQAVMRFLSRLVEIKFLSITQVVNCWNRIRLNRLPQHKIERGFRRNQKKNSCMMYYVCTMHACQGRSEEAKAGGCSIVFADNISAANK